MKVAGGESYKITNFNICYLPKMCDQFKNGETGEKCG